MPEDSLKFKRPVISKQISQTKKEHAKRILSWSIYMNNRQNQI